MSQNPLHSFPSSPFGFIGRDLKMIYEKESEKQYTQHLITGKYESRKVCIIRGPRCTLFSKSNKKSFCFNVFIIQPRKVKYT